MKSNQRKLVLLVDDDNNFLESCRRIFRRTDISLFAISSVSDAISLLHEVKFHSIICDLNMPFLSGVEFLKNTYTTQPDAKRILITGEPSLASLTLGVNTCRLHGYFTKPFSAKELIQYINEA